MSEPRDHDIWLTDWLGQRSMQIQVAKNVRIEKFLQGIEQFSFELKLDDQKLDYIHEDQTIEAYGDVWIVDHFEDKHVTAGYRKVVCNADWIRLSWIIKFGPYSLLGETPEAGLAKILSGTDWTVVNPPASVKLYTMEEIDGTILSLLRRWAYITGYEIEFDTINKTVEFKEEVGETRHIGFTWGRNIKEITRTYYPPQATRLYPVGANDLTISNANPTGLPYIENYDFYLAQGLTLTQARARYRKDLPWVDQRYLLEVNLYDAAVARLAKLAQPRIFYKANVFDLSRVMGVDADPMAFGFKPGDYAPIDDEELGLLEQVRITRTVVYPAEPKRDEVELGFLTNGLLDVSDGGSRDLDYSDIFMIVDQNIDELLINATSTNYGAIALTSAGSASVITGSTFVGTASGTGTVEFRMVLDGVTQGQAYSKAFTDGQLVEFSWPSLSSDIPEGAHEIHWRAQVIGGSGIITLEPEAGRSWVLSRGAVGVGVNTSPNAFVSEELDEWLGAFMEDWTIEFVKNVDVLVTTYEDTLTEEYEDLTDEFILPFQLESPVFGEMDSIFGLSGPSDPRDLGFTRYSPPPGGSEGGSDNYGPGGSGGPPDPILSLGPEVWLRGSVGRVVTGSALNTWLDQSGNGWDATAYVGREPVWNSHTINGEVGIYFATGDAMVFDDGLLAALDAAGAGELFAVIKGDTDSANHGAFFQGFQGAPEYHHMMYSDGKWYAAFGRSTRVDTGNPSEAVNADTLVNMRSDSTEWSLHLNEVQHYTTATNTVDFTGGPTSFGGSAKGQLGGDPNANSGAGVWWAGVIAEFIIFPFKLTPAERADVIAELNSIYGV